MHRKGWARQSPRRNAAPKVTVQNIQPLVAPMMLCSVPMTWSSGLRKAVKPTENRHGEGECGVLDGGSFQVIANGMT